MPLTVVKSFFQAGFFDALCCHLAASFRTASSAASEKSGSCSA